MLPAGFKFSPWGSLDCRKLCHGPLAVCAAAMIACLFSRDVPRAAAASGDKRPKTVTFKKTVQPFLGKYCLGCHGAKKPRAGLRLNRFTTEKSLLAEPKTWAKVFEMLDTDAMPPDDHKLRPSTAESAQIAGWIKQKFGLVDCDGDADPGRVTIRRLNRVEYNNTIRDLVGVNFQPAKDFPSDDVGYGFDNIGDVLTLPPLLMEKYLRAAETITAAAIFVGDPSRLTATRLSGRRLSRKGAAHYVRRVDTYAMASSGGVLGQFVFPQPGRYIIRIVAAADQAGSEPAKMAVRIDGKTVRVLEVKGQRTRGTYETRVSVGRGKIATGKRRIAAWFINDYYNPKAKNPRDRDRNLYVKSIELQGPLGLKNVKLPATHSRILFVRPGPERTAKQAARLIFRRFLFRAFRRPVTDNEIEPYVKLTELAMRRGEPFERGVQLGVQAALVSPHFLFRIERDLHPDDPRAAHQIGEYELASRLSYFLWSSLPDDELFKLAGKGTLHRPQVLEQQTRRMLADPKARALVENFGGQWLNLRNLAEATPSRRQFPTFNPQLRSDMRRETELFFEHVMRSDASVLDFLGGRYTFLNERLAVHYGIKGVKGDRFRKVSLAGTRRAGVLTQGSILTLTSFPTRTAPVKRGKWILENILGTPPPPPPPNVPALEVTAHKQPHASLREQLAIHRKNPVCASCHNAMDPLGLGLENFDAIGRWRDKDGRHPIDATGKLPTGEHFNGPIELIQILKKRREKFVRHFSRAMLTYALGRGLEYYDRCAVNHIVTAASEHDNRFSAVVLGVVRSRPFLMRRGDGGQ